IDGTTSGNGIYLNSTSNVSLTRMHLHDFDNFAIHGVSVTAFTLANSLVDGANGNNIAIDEGSIGFDNLLGSAAITNSSISGGLEDNLNVLNTSGTLNRLVISGSTFGFNSTVNGNNNLKIE